MPPLPSIFSIPTTEEMRTIFLNCITQHELLNETHKKYQAHLAKKMTEQAAFDPSILAVPGVDPYVIMYGALYSQQAWEALLQAEEKKTQGLASFVRYVRCERIEIVEPGTFQQRLFNILAEHLADHIIRTKWPGRKDANISECLEHAAKGHVEMLSKDLPKEYRSSNMESLAEEISSALETSLSFFDGQEEIYQYALAILSLLQKDAIMSSMMLLARFGSVSAFDYLRTLFNMLSNAYRELAGADVKNQLALTMVFLFFYQTLEVERIFGKRAQEYQLIFLTMIMLNSCSAVRATQPLSSEVLSFSAIFEGIQAIITRGLEEERLPAMAATPSLQAP